MYLRAHVLLCTAMYVCVCVSECVYVSECVCLCLCVSLGGLVSWWAGGWVGGCLGGWVRACVRVHWCRVHVMSLRSTLLNVCDDLRCPPGEYPPQSDELHCKKDLMNVIIDRSTHDISIIILKIQNDKHV